MRCYKCNSILTDSDYCIKCGADVSVYKVVVKASNAYYNMGLEKAQVRDLSGAIVALRTSLNINKSNIKARNLLGLVYFEMGEVAEALREWVVSLNLKPEKNVASAYIRKVKANQNRLAQLNQATKKYNLSLHKLQEGGEDVALIQLKKVVNDNPHFVKALLLLALVYMKRGENDKALKQLQKALKVDRNNTLALRYMDELHQTGIASDKGEENYYRGRRRKQEVVLSGHDVITPSTAYKEPTNGVLTALQILLGVVIGAALIWFLVVPSRTEIIKQQTNDTILNLNEQLSDYSIKLSQLKSTNEELAEKLALAEEEIEDITSDNGQLAMYRALVEAANMYLDGDYENTAVLLIDIDITKLPTEVAKSLYATMEESCNNGARTYYLAGINAYNRADYISAINYLKISYTYDASTVETPYYLALSYLQLSNAEEAQQYVDIVNNNFGGTTYANQLAQFIAAQNK